MLYIMRHGKTDWNEAKKLQGRTDIPLNEEGRRMAKEAGERYRDVHFDVCYSSPLARALETAELVLAGRNVPVITDERLVELSFGEYEGSAYISQRPDCPINVLFTDPEKYTQSVGGSETLDELYKRTGAFLTEVAGPEIRAGRDVLIVGHGATNAGIVCQIRNLPAEQFWSVDVEQCKLLELSDFQPDQDDDHDPAE